MNVIRINTKPDTNGSYKHHGTTHFVDFQIFQIFSLFENQQHTLFHYVCNRRLCYVFNEAEVAEKEKYLQSLRSCMPKRQKTKFREQKCKQIFLYVLLLYIISFQKQHEKFSLRTECQEIAP